MEKFGKMIADAATVGMRYADRLLGDIPSERFARLAIPGDKAIESNHPAFIIGHLCLYPEKVTSLLRVDSSKTQPTPDFAEKFAKGAACTDDPDGVLYPNKEVLCGFFTSSYASAILAITHADDSLLQSENPVDTPMKQVCPTLGAMLNFYLTGHVMVHLGQLSAWRRMEGLPPV